MKLKLSLGLSAVVLLSACGGSGSGTDGATPDVVTLDALIARNDAFVAAIGTDNFEEVEPTAFANLPTTGSQSYTGTAFVGLEDTGDNDDNTFLAVGSTNLTANFTDQSISGSADNFFQLTDPNLDDFADATGERIDGTLSYEFDQIAADTNAYGGQITGSLTPTDMPEITIDVAGGGAFIGENAEGFVVEAFNDDTDYFVGVLATKD